MLIHARFDPNQPNCVMAYFNLPWRHFRMQNYNFFFIHANISLPNFTQFFQFLHPTLIDPVSMISRIEVAIDFFTNFAQILSP